MGFVLVKQYINFKIIKNPSTKQSERNVPFFLLQNRNQAFDSFDEANRKCTNLVWKSLKSIKTISIP